jgi:hypothetical protein
LQNKFVHYGISINLFYLKVDALIKSGVKIEKVVVSPMTRTLQTAWGTFNGHSIPFQVVALKFW